MEESRDLQKLHNSFRYAVYVIAALDIIIHFYLNDIDNIIANKILSGFAKVAIFQDPFYTKLLLFVLICLTGIGTLSKKKKDIDVPKQIVIPVILGLLCMFGSLFFVGKGESEDILPYTNIWQLGYAFTTILGAILLSVGVDNVSKIIKSNFGKDEWNIEGESFMQETELKETPYSVNIPTQFYYQKKIHNGWLNIDVFRGIVVIGVPGSGKSFGVINPIIRQMVHKHFCICLYDFKFPDLSQIAYCHYLIEKKRNPAYKHQFKVLNLDDIEKSVRVNPLHPKYIRTLAQAQETADAMVNALKKGNVSSGGSEQFFTESAINFLSAVIFFFAKYEKGKYSSLPYIMAFLNMKYDTVFDVLFTNTEISSLLSPFVSAYEKKAFDQLEGQIGTLKIFMSKLATKESYYIFNAEEIELDIANPEHPTLLILASNPQTKNINSTLYSFVLNRVTTLLNSKENIQSAIIADECPTISIYRIEDIIATARSNKVSVVLGLQELPQFKKQYGKETADTIMSVIGNILCGAVRHKETLDWLQTLFGKKKQQGETLNIDRQKTSLSMNERLDNLIPSGKISGLNVGEMVGMLAGDSDNLMQYKTNVVHCKINLNIDEIEKEKKLYRPTPQTRVFKEDKEDFLLKYMENIKSQMEQVTQSIINNR